MKLEMSAMMRQTFFQLPIHVNSQAAIRLACQELKGSQKLDDRFPKPLLKHKNPVAPHTLQMLFQP